MNSDKPQGNKSHARRSEPLWGRTILVTRTEKQAQEFARTIEELGGRVAYFPTIEIVPPDSWMDCDAAIRRLNTYDLLVFTSTNAVDRFLDRALVVDGWSLSTIRQKQVYAVGEKTRGALVLRGCPVKDIPEKSTAEELGELLSKMDLKGKRILLPRGNLGSKVLPRILSQSGAKVEEILVYKTQKPKTERAREIERTLREKQIDVITFFSPSSVRNFAEVVPLEALKGVVVAVIGEITAKAAQELGISVNVVPPAATSESLARALGAFYVSLPAGSQP